MNSWKQIVADVFAGKHSGFTLLIGIYFCILLYYFIRWPIVAYDTDLWYHLNGGRYFWENAQIARDAFFSYIDSSQDWYNYYWLFQALIYPVYLLTGYPGLIIFRAILFVSTTLFIYLFFRRKDNANPTLILGLGIFAAYPLALTVRELLIRPHLFSYLFIVVFLYILEVKRNRIWLLPLLAVLWANIHGIEYPVMMLILLAYLIEMYYSDFRKNKDYSGTKTQKWFIIISLYTIFLTPKFIELVSVPFSVTYGNALYQHMYISELIPLSIPQIFRFSVLPPSDFLVTLRNLLIISGFACFIYCLGKRKLRLSHAVLFIASIPLLLKHGRFSYEFILLCMPMVRQTVELATQKAKMHPIDKYRWPYLVLFVLLCALPFAVYQNYFKYRPEYPVSQLKLPVGVAKFIQTHDLPGNVLNEPNTGGYLQWMLNGRNKIYMDMQLSLFSDRDFAFATGALDDKHAFNNFLKQYDPAFVSVSLSRADFPKMISSNPSFQLIFFDDVEALYINAKRYPELALTYNLTAIDPFQYQTIQYGKMDEKRRQAILGEAQKILEIHPGCGIANTIVANVLIAQAQYEKVVPYAEAVTRHYPNSSKGYILKGDAFRGLERAQDAIVQYEAAIQRGLDQEEGKVYWNLHTCYGHLKQYKKAYQAISSFVNPFHPQAAYQDIYALAITAANAGQTRDAVNFLKIAQLKLPPDDEEYSKKITENLALLDPQGKRRYSQ